MRSQSTCGQQLCKRLFGLTSADETVQTAQMQAGCRQDCHGTSKGKVAEVAAMAAAAPQAMMTGGGSSSVFLTCATHSSVAAHSAQAARAPADVQMEADLGRAVPGTLTLA